MPFNMQDTKTLTDLGFRNKPSLNDNEYLFRGRHQKFVAIAHKDAGTTYVSLYMVSTEIDRRPLSSRYGLFYRSVVKDCCSIGSVEKAIAKYDLTEDQISRSGITVTIKNTVNV